MEEARADTISIVCSMSRLNVRTFFRRCGYNQRLTKANDKLPDSGFGPNRCRSANSTTINDIVLIQRREVVIAESCTSAPSVRVRHLCEVSSSSMSVTITTHSRLFLPGFSGCAFHLTSSLSA